jgi:hypothetical protein
MTLPFRRPAGALLAAPAVAVLVFAAAAVSPPVPSRLAPVLFPENADWRMTNLSGGPTDLTVAQVDGRPVFRTGPSGLTLTSKKKLTGDVELRLRFRMTSPEDKGCSLVVRPGLPQGDSPVTNPLHVQLTIAAGPEPESLTWTLQPQPGQKDAVAGNYRIRNLPKNRLAWPEMVRRRLEADTAAEPRLTERWLTLRYQLRKHQARVFLDDRLLRGAGHPALDTSGFVQLVCSRGVEIASVSLVPLSAADWRFETVALEGYVNTGRFRNDMVKLPGKGKAVHVGGVPFRLPAPDPGGRDHVDLGPSWLACGLVPGDFYAFYSDLERWGGALYREPGRIQFRVPNAPYTKLHLLAAATGEPDTTATVTAQFYRDLAGAPVNFAGTVPLFSAPAAPHALPAALAGGAKLNLHLVTIPLEPDGVSAFSDLDHLEFELTKKVLPYRSFPDPIQYSQHGAGLPSGVHVFGITLEHPAVTVELRPDAFAHVWTAPAVPSYTATLHNSSPAAQVVALDLQTRAFDQLQRSVVRDRLRLAPGETKAVPLRVPGLKRYGHHAVRLRAWTAAGQNPDALRADPKADKRRWDLSLAYLHPDTRERGNWEEGKGPIFGMWDWNGGHLTPSGLPRLKVMAAAGMESSMASFATPTLPAEEKAFLEAIGAKSFFLAYQLSMTKDTLGGKEWDPKQPAAMQQALVAWLKSQPMAKPSKINSPELAVFFAEPLLGPVSYMSQPEHYGEPPHRLTAEEQAAYQKYLDQFVIAGTAIKKEWPHAKLLFPWGIPTFPIPFLRHSKEARDLMDGPALDVVLFERLPEMQLHQVTLSSGLWQLKQEWLKAGKLWPKFTTIEGPCVSPAAPAALTVRQEADHTVRAFLILAAYGATRHLGNPVPFHCAGYWGETHYGTGLCDRLPRLTPRPVFSAYAALTRQLNRMNFTKLVPTGSNTVLCLQFKHYKTGELLHVLWTLRGRRPVSVAAAATAKLTWYDSMDNPTVLPVKDGKARFTLSPAPCYLRGLSADARLTLGVPDHSDARPAAEVVRLGELGDGTWQLSAERDPHYEDSHAEFVRRFPGKFSVRPVAAAATFGKALAVHLEKQDKERKTMPFYTTLIPAKPLVIPGKASHLGLWVRASSDWGRVVYCLRDARGERWVSVGQKGEWNVDDTHCWSQFCFDGKRYLRFELPGNASYDLYREMGTCYWGHYGPGDAVVDYPLTLEKIIVERRTHVIAGTELVPASPDDVLLGGLYAEYETAADKTPEAVRLAQLRMPLPASPPELVNPLKKLTETGTGEGPVITKITPPERDPDGRRCHVHFAALPAAVKYDIWVSPYADGRGAVQLAASWSKPGGLLTGLSPNTDFYLFVVAADKAGKHTRPGKPYKINLKDMFPMK